jgi:hypothetical protein
MLVSRVSGWPDRGTPDAPPATHPLEDTVVERGSAKHGFLKDDELEREVENEMRGVGPTRAEQWREPELPDDEEAAELGLDGPLRPELRDKD